MFTITPESEPEKPQQPLIRKSTGSAKNAGEPALIMFCAALPSESAARFIATAQTVRIAEPQNAGDP